MGRRSAIRDGRRQAMGRAPRLDSADLQRGGGTPESDQSVLDAAADGNSQRARARLGRVFDPAVDVSRTAGDFFVLGVCADIGMMCGPDILVWPCPVRQECLTHTFTPSKSPSNSLLHLSRP